MFFGKQHFDSLSEEHQLSRLKSDANFARLFQKLDGQQQLAEEAKRHHQTEYHKKAQQSLRDYYNKHYAHIKAAFDKDQWPIDKSYVQLAIVRRRQVLQILEKECKELGQSKPQRQQLVAAYESIHGLKTSVNLSQLFDKRKKNPRQRGDGNPHGAFGRARWRRQDHPVSQNCPYVGQRQVVQEQVRSRLRTTDKEAEKEHLHWPM